MNIEALYPIDKRHRSPLSIPAAGCCGKGSLSDRKTDMESGRGHRRGVRWSCLMGLVLVWAAGARGLAGQAAGGMLFSYEPYAGRRASFDEGYRSHLEWHRANRDSLPWYGWDVVAGRRLGQFVDGTFGV